MKYVSFPTCSVVPNALTVSPKWIWLPFTLKKSAKPLSSIALVYSNASTSVILSDSILDTTPTTASVPLDSAINSDGFAKVRV